MAWDRLHRQASAGSHGARYKILNGRSRAENGVVSQGVSGGQDLARECFRSGTKPSSPNVQPESVRNRVRKDGHHGFSVELGAWEQAWGNNRAVHNPGASLGRNPVECVRCGNFCEHRHHTREGVSK